ncbi:IclR family transcriptional regulator [Pseudorhodoferax sp.]|uniref:IclR family transcriptional regulator n=1 Tax=Pseudorhodoferax sp. TaxID=1993553 RepID=UPI002DD6AE00|nr:helix-turn-helix domain-containing protein [Pseudorhodoferax sp.]
MKLADLALESAAPTGPERAGTQSLARGIKLLRTIATRPDFGWRLSDLAAACGQDKATVHRMLGCMVDERLVVQRASDRHYLPGPLMFELGFALPDRVQFQRQAEPVVAAFARRMAGIGLLLLRSGNEYVCAVRAGSLALSGLMVYPGTRRPLFTSVGGVAILQTRPEAEVRAVLLDNVAQEIGRRGTGRLEALQKMRERSDRHGFGVNLGDVVPGVHALAVPVCDGAGEAFAALCLIGTPELYGEELLSQLQQELQATAALLATEARKFNM